MPRGPLPTAGTPKRGAGEPQGLSTDSRCPRTWTKKTFPSLSSVSSDRSSTSLRPWAEPTRAQGTVTAVAVTRRHQEAVISHQGGTRRRHTRPALLRGHRRWSARRGSWTCSQGSRCTAISQAHFKHTFLTACSQRQFPLSSQASSLMASTPASRRVSGRRPPEVRGRGPCPKPVFTLTLLHPASTCLLLQCHHRGTTLTFQKWGLLVAHTTARGSCGEPRF